MLYSLTYINLIMPEPFKAIVCTTPAQRGQKLDCIIDNKTIQGISQIQAKTPIIGSIVRSPGQIFFGLQGDGQYEMFENVLKLTTPKIPKIPTPTPTPPDKKKYTEFTQIDGTTLGRLAGRGAKEIPIKWRDIAMRMLNAGVIGNKEEMQKIMNRAAMPGPSQEIFKAWIDESFKKPPNKNAIKMKAIQLLGRI